jgi:hypothetical protein
MCAGGRDVKTARAPTVDDFAPLPDDVHWPSFAPDHSDWDCPDCGSDSRECLGLCEPIVVAEAEPLRVPFFEAARAA